MPRSGKTEQINKLGSYFSKKELKYLVITDREVEKEINTPINQAFEYNLRFYKKILEKLLDAQNRKFDILILDRGFSEAEVWLNVEFKQGHLTEIEKEKALEYIEGFKNHINLGIFMIVPPIVTKKRHKKKGESGKTDDYVLNTYLEELYKEYLKLKEKLKADNKILVLDGEESVKIIGEKIKNKLVKMKIV